MVGCGKGQFRKAYENFLANDAGKLSGRMLSIYDSQDRISRSCKEPKAKSAQLVFEEQVLEVGTGQGTFYTPRKAWVEKVAAWSKAAKG